MRNLLLKVLGPIGYLGKSILYSTIGVLSMLSALADRHQDTTDESPQGVFLLLSDTGSAVGMVLLIGMLICIGCYILWRIMEAFLVRTSPNLENMDSPVRRIFRYRFSPLVSAAIYTAYAVFLVDTLIERRKSVDSNSCFPSCWQATGLGIAGLSLLGIAFLIGAITQVEMAVSRDYLSEIKVEVRDHRWMRFLLILLGSLGHVGRALLFGLVAVSFFMLASGTNIWVDPTHGTLGQTLNHWILEPGGRFFLFLTGFLLLVFGLFVFVSIFARTFPTHVVPEPEEEA